VTGPPLPKRIP